MPQPVTVAWNIPVERPGIVWDGDPETAWTIVAWANGHGKAAWVRDSDGCIVIRSDGLDREVHSGYAAVLMPNGVIEVLERGEFEVLPPSPLGL